MDHQVNPQKARSAFILYRYENRTPEKVYLVNYVFLGNSLLTYVNKFCLEENQYVRGASQECV